jgi:hypothetical protein
MASTRGPGALAGLAAAGWLWACAALPAGPTSAPAAAARVVAEGQPFTLAPGERAAPEGARVELEFRAVEADSRCPRDVTCVWSGDAVVAVALGAGEDADLLRLHTNLEPKAATAQGLRVELVELSPYPVSAAKIPPGDYRVTLRAARAEAAQ